LEKRLPGNGGYRSARSKERALHEGVAVPVASTEADIAPSGEVPVVHSPIVLIWSMWNPSHETASERLGARRGTRADAVGGSR
jgi:hypothetical protein